MGGRGGESGLDGPFKLAKTIEEANKYLSKLQGTKAEFSNVSLTVANAVNEAAKEIYDRFKIKLGINKVQRMKAGWEKYMYAGYQNHRLDIKGNPTTWEKSAEKNFSSRWIASGDKYGTLYHEFGHALWEKLTPGQQSQITRVYERERHKAYEDWMAAGGSRSGKTQADFFGKTLSRYAHTSNTEFFSEAFSQIMSRRMRPVSREILQIIK